MKFASLLATLSLAASTFAVYVTSADGTKIWAEATGNPKKPAVVLIPGFSCSSLAFSKQWSDPSMTSNLYMVGHFFERLPYKITDRLTRIPAGPL